MGFYAAPSYNNQSTIVLSGAYTAPVAHACNKTLSNTGPYQYAAPSHTEVRATLASGYTKPNHNAVNATLSKRLSAGANQFVEAIGIEQSNQIPDTLNVYLKQRKVLVNQKPTIDNVILELSLNYNGDSGHRLVVLVAYGNHFSSGNHVIEPKNKTIKPLAFESSVFSENVALKNGSSKIYPESIDSQEFSDYADVANVNQVILHEGFESSEFYSPLVYNKKQFFPLYGIDSLEVGEPYLAGGVKHLEPYSIDSEEFGEAYLFGGVRWLYSYGFDSAEFGDVSVVNTTANRVLEIDGIRPLSLGSPIVNPRSLYPEAIPPINIPQPLIQRSPMPKGDDHSVYGMPTIWYRVRPIFAKGIDSFDSGYPRVFDPTQIVYVSPPQETALFGDVAIKNNRRIIDVSGFNDLTVSQWAELRARNRVIQTIGVDNASVGNFEISNATPSLQPSGFVGEFGTAFISSHIRYISPTGFDTAIVGDAQVERTPSFAPEPFDATLFGDTWVSNKYRQIYAEGFNKSGFGETIAWHYRRYIDVSGNSWLDVGSQTVTHGVRELIAQGVNTDSFGEPWASFKKRYIEVESISSDNKNSSNHRVGRNIVISPNGFIASLFGERIIPIAQDIYPQSFVADFGLANVDLKTRYVLVDGFITTFDPIKKTQVQLGDVLVFNKRQYIKQQYDGDNGLVPMPFGLWTAIENRNRNMGVFGFNAAKFGTPLIQNNAYPVIPDSIKSNIFGVSMIAFSVRRIIGESINPIPISHWNIINNTARIVSAKGFVGEFGDADIKNTRRYYDRVGNWNSQELGSPMIAYRVRNIDIESRYAITPPYINLPTIEKLTNYIEVKGFSADGTWVLSVGSPYLAIHRNIITPRWTLKDYFGEPFIWNKTPEVKIFGHDSAEFGVASLRTQWRKVLAIGDNVNLFGLHKISDTKQYIAMMNGVSAPNISQYHKVIKGQSPAYALQYIFHDDSKSGFDSLIFGIAGMNQNVLYAEGILSQNFGDTLLWSNNIAIKYGIAQEQEVGSPIVSNRNNYIDVDGLNNEISVGVPAIKLQTIYPYNEDVDGGLTGARMGLASVENQHRRLFLYGINTLGMGDDVIIDLATRYIKPSAIRLPYFGIPSIPFVPQNIEIKGIDSFIGGAQVVDYPPYKGVQYVKPYGFDALEFGYEEVELKNRRIEVIGFNELEFGYSRRDNPYMWQSLRIGELVPFQLDGFDSTIFGSSMISLKIRGVSIDGFDALTMDYESKYFSKRMRVVLANQVNLDKTVSILGINDSSIGVPGVKLGQHFIRPDGDSETYRQGVGEWM